MLAGMMVTSNVLPAYSATDGIAVEQADASYEAEAAAADASADAENSEVGGASSEQGDAEKPVTDGTDSTTDASANAGAGSDVTDAAAGEQTTANKSEATDGAATEESKSDAANGTATEESKADAANGTATEESKADATNGAETEESKSDAGHGTGAEESKADAVHGSNAGGSSVVGAGSVDIDESTGAAAEIEETKPGELLEEETKLATESEIPKEEDEKKLEEKENRKTIYIAFGKGVKVTATLEDANAVPDEVFALLKTLVDDAQNSADGKAKIEIGSYTGTGTYDSGNPNTLTFSFVPKIIFVQGESNSNVRNAGFAVLIPENPNGSMHDLATAGILAVSIESTTVSWYATAVIGSNGTTATANAGTMLNYSGKKYYYVAFG